MPLETPRGILNRWDEIQSTDWLPYDKFSPANVVKTVLPGDIVSCHLVSDSKDSIFYGVVAETPGQGATPDSRFVETSPVHESRSEFARSFLSKSRSRDEDCESLVPFGCRLHVRSSHASLPVLAALLRMQNLDGTPGAPTPCAHPFDVNDVFVARPDMTRQDRDKALIKLVLSTWDVRWKLRVLVPEPYRRQHYLDLLPEYLTARALRSCRVLQPGGQSDLEFLRSREPRTIGSLNWIGAKRIRSTPREPALLFYPSGFQVEEVDDIPEHFASEVGIRDPADGHVVVERVGQTRDGERFLEQTRPYVESEEAFLVAKFFRHFDTRPGTFADLRPSTLPIIDVRRIFRGSRPPKCAKRRKLEDS